ncbi:dihydrofolate reductase [Nocardia transvalensis]|uniref:Dihydrofolate reductase n=1 Tax=Nocardia transvalensis TaxID=37333 RepID=A0A7W9PJ94_9NOCA|nr:dihydrofolate reductase family protein [Nocardia transvalensis]MBB5916634.1 dihydrofolate reductase [Nocardia transvalensis]
MEGGTTFHFVTEGIAAAFDLAREAAGDGNISIHGGACTVNQYLAAGLIDELRLRIVPITLGAGTRLFDGVPGLTLRQLTTRTGPAFTHVTYRVVR